jgi:hypothetical protein
VRFRLALSIGSALTLVACTGSPTASTSTGNTTTPAPVVTAHGSMNATIDGTRWDASAYLLATQQIGIVAVSGTNAFSNYTTVTFAVPATVGTYQVAPLTIANASVDFIATADSKWASLAAGSNGTVTLTTLTSTGARGTFSFNLLPLAAPATGTKVVTNGVFNVTF